MTTTAEERAKAIVKQVDDMEGVSGWLGTLVEALIAKAIHQAQNDKLEEAAKIVDEHWGAGCGSGDMAHPMTLYVGPSASDRIRSLKTPKD